MILTKIIQAAKYCKNDLCSEIVFEFPELQGIMGGKYLKYEGFSEENKPVKGLAQLFKNKVVNYTIDKRRIEEKVGAEYLNIPRHEIEPDDGVIHYYYAWTTQDKQVRLDEFEKFLAQKKAAGDSYFHILNALGYGYYNIGDKAKAKSYFRECVRLS